MKIFALLIFMFQIISAYPQVGNWNYDQAGLPVFNYTGLLPYQTPNNASGDIKQSDDPYFILGNHRLTVFQHVSGNYQILSGERAWGTLNKGKDDYYSWSESTLSIDNKNYTLTGLNSLALEKETEKEFGCGYACFKYDIKGIQCIRTLSVKPSEGVKKGTPAILISIQLSNSSGRKVHISFNEKILASYKMAGQDTAVYYLCNSEINPTKDAVKTNFSLHSKDPYLTPSRNEPSYYDVNPPVLFMKNHRSNESKASVTFEKKDSTEHMQSISYSFDLAANEAKNLSFVVGYEFNTSFDDIKKVYTDIDTKDITFQKEWRMTIPSFIKETNPVLKRELQWDAYVLEAMSTYVSVYDETFIPQGMSYDYLFGNPAAFRDHAQAGLPLCYFDTDLAKSVLKTCMQKIMYSGEIRYTDKGYGSTTNLTWNTSDQQLYFFLFLSEYLRITKDYSILTEKTRWYPTVFQKEGTTLEKVRQAFFYLRDEVAFGTNGLIRIMNSDWNDMIFQTHPINLYFWTASSHLNSAMAIVVLENLITQLQTGLNKISALDNKEWQLLLSSMKIYREKVKTAFDREMEGREFSPRGYLNKDFVFGQDNMYLEPQPWILLRSDIPVKRKQELFNKVKSKLMKDEVLGARQLQNALQDEKGIDSKSEGVGENGGFWFSLNGPLILGVNTFDHKEANELLMQMTFNNYTANYPDYWIGQWSNADCVNSSISEYPGLSRRNEWTKFPVFCSHPHAWFIYCYFKLKE